MFDQIAGQATVHGAKGQQVREKVAPNIARNKGFDERSQEAQGLTRGKG